MFLEKTIKRNPDLIRAAFYLHQSGQILPDTFILDLDTFRENAVKILAKADKNDIELYFMLKQVGRNPYLAGILKDMGYKGAVVVDYREAQVMMKHHIPICNVGHLIQPPRALLNELVSYGCDYFTVYSPEKIREINACAKEIGIVQKLLVRVTDRGDAVYSGQTAGFSPEEIPKLCRETSKLSNVKIAGVTSFPCFLYDEEKREIEAAPNMRTLVRAKEIFEKNGVRISNVNAPSTTSVATLEKMKEYPVGSAEPGHGLTGTTPLHAARDLEERPCVVYLSEVSHNFEKKAYCYGGGCYRRGHIQNALVGTDWENARREKVICPALESIDYYFGLEHEAKVSESVVMAFRFQMFVSRSDLCIVSGIRNGDPRIVKIYNSLGDEKK